MINTFYKSIIYRLKKGNMVDMVIEEEGSLQKTGIYNRKKDEKVV